MKKIKKIELLEERLVKLEKDLKDRSELLTDLLDYLMRVDPNFINDPGSFDSWYSRLAKMRLDEERRRACMKAKQIVEDNGFVVAKNLTDLDAARMKQWVSSKPANDDDDPPF